MKALQIVATGVEDAEARLDALSAAIGQADPASARGVPLRLKLALARARADYDAWWARAGWVCLRGENNDAHLA